ncbi:hypothetical protein, partial [Xanthomonas oryzae]|uniref:hypothetical protein n=1 Tax=Xanthomonas oryzae TaxID=347 RepID=UPI001C679B38
MRRHADEHTTPIAQHRITRHTHAGAQDPFSMRLAAPSATIWSVVLGAINRCLFTTPAARPAGLRAVRP